MPEATCGCVVLYELGPARVEWAFYVPLHQAVCVQFLGRACGTRHIKSSVHFVHGAALGLCGCVRVCASSLPNKYNIVCCLRHGTRFQCMCSDLTM